MGFGDRLKELRDQAQQAVAENKDKIQGAVQAAGAIANERTEGRYADRIAKVGERVSASVERVAAAEAPEQQEPGQQEPGPAQHGAPAPPEFE